MRYSMKIFWMLLTIAGFACKNDETIVDPLIEDWSVSGRILYQRRIYGADQSPTTFIFDLGASNSDPKVVSLAGYFVHLSDDGKRIVAVGPTFPSDYTWNLFTVDIDSGTIRNVPRSGRYREWDARWSPDGSRIIFAAEYIAVPWPDPHAICTVKPDGSDFHALTDTTQTQSPPTWPTFSPSGSEIAYIRNLHPGSPSPAVLAIISPDGLHQVDLGDAYAPVPPEWSPNGQFIVYARLLTAPGDTNAVRVFVYNVVSSTSSQVAPGAKVTPFGMIWTADGKLACVGNANNYNPASGSGLSVLLCSATTLQVEKVLVDGGFKMTSLVASPNGKYVGIFGIRNQQEGYAFYLSKTQQGGLRFVKSLSSYSDSTLFQYNPYWRP